MKQIITRVDDDLAAALKERAHRAGVSVNSYVTSLLRAVTYGQEQPPTARDIWKAAALADGRLVRRGVVARRPPLRPNISTPAGYAADLVSRERDER
jgi:plasmid stability protein